MSVKVAKNIDGVKGNEKDTGAGSFALTLIPILGIYPSLWVERGRFEETYCQICWEVLITSG